MRLVLFHWDRNQTKTLRALDLSRLAKFLAETRRNVAQSLLSCWFDSACNPSCLELNLKLPLKLQFYTVRTAILFACGLPNGWRPAPWVLQRVPAGVSRQARQPGGTRQRRFAGTNSKLRKLQKNAPTPTTCPDAPRGSGALSRCTCGTLY